MRNPSIGFMLLAIAILAVPARATPPDYATFGRTQQVNRTPNPDDLMRIWLVYVEQGDGLLIQLPPRCNYDPDPQDGDSTRSERVDILIDGGANPRSQAWRMAEFVETLYGADGGTLEYAVITHHDQDHVLGLGDLLDETAFSIDTIYHNGLASYVGGARFDGAPDFPTSSRPQDAVYKWSSGHVTRGMAFLEPGTSNLRPEYLIDSLSELRSAFNDNKLQGVYLGLADAIVGKSSPAPVRRFNRASAGSAFIAEREMQLSRGVDLNGIQFEVIWPPDQLREYGGRNWGETINGNSVTFRLTYGDFQMLFTGDHNDKSEQALLDTLRAQNQLELLECDVLKVPHHGSSHGIKDFFDQIDPVVSVASMGEQGFKSKKLNSRNWQHPSTDVIRWLGGAHRVYHTLIHERRFNWSDLDTMAKHHAMMEYSHVLIETDGEWFRIVEVPDIETDLNNPPTVQQTRRGNGTRWIRAR